MATQGKAKEKRPPSPWIGVEPPGPRSREMMALKDAYVTSGLRTALPIVLNRAEGAFVEDVDGNRYVDLTGGIGVHTAGHRPDAITGEVRRQLDRLTHICMMVTGYEPYLALARRMAEVSPAGALTKSIFLNSGSEAIENAAKIARASTGKKYFISFRTAFHGRTLLGISLTGKERPYREGFGPLLPEVVHLDFPYVYRSPHGEGADQATLAALEGLLSGPPHEGNVAALFVEPVQGEGGIIVPPRGFLPGLAKICRSHNVLLIDDEVQAGLGRTGRMWSIEHSGVVPDIMVSGKALGGGLPIGGVTGRADIMDAPGPGSLGGTFGGNPLSCVAGLESIKLVQGLIPRASLVESLLARSLTRLQERHPLVGDVRGVGAMWAIEFVKDRDTKEPAADEARRTQLECLRRGLLVITAGYHNNCVRFLPPLNIPEEALEASLAIVDQALRAVEA